jgi:hypothetical protein
MQWSELCQLQEFAISPQTIDIDALDSLLAASLRPSSSSQVVRPAAEVSCRPRQRIDRPTRFLQATEASCPVIPRTPSTTACVPKRPDRPHSCIPVSASSRRARLLSLTASKAQPKPSSSEIQQPAASTAGPKSLVRLVDGVQCIVRASGRSDSDGQCALHLEVTSVPSGESNNQTDTAMELTLNTAEVRQASYKLCRFTSQLTAHATARSSSCSDQEEPPRST